MFSWCKFNNQAGVKPPLILAGHSAGGLYVREYARESGWERLRGNCRVPAKDFPGWRVNMMRWRADRTMWTPTIANWSISTRHPSKPGGSPASATNRSSLSRETLTFKEMSARALAEVPTWDRGTRDVEIPFCSMLACHCPKLRTHGPARQARLNHRRNDAPAGLFTWWPGTLFWEHDHGLTHSSHFTEPKSSAILNLAGE